MTPNDEKAPPEAPVVESYVNILALVESKACGKDFDTLVAGEYIFPLLAAEAIRQLQKLVAEGVRISTAARAIAAHHGLIAQTLNDLVNLAIPNTVEELCEVVSQAAGQARAAQVAEASLSREMLKQAAMDFIFTTRDIVGIAKLILKRVSPLKKSKDLPEDPAP